MIKSASDVNSELKIRHNLKTVGQADIVKLIVNYKWLTLRWIVVCQKLLFILCEVNGIVIASIGITTSQTIIQNAFSVIKWRMTLSAFSLVNLLKSNVLLGARYPFNGRQFL